MTKEQEYLLAKVRDKIGECESKCVITSTSFLDMAERSDVDSSVKKSGVKYVFYGGFDEAERTVCVFLPYYADDFESFILENPEENPLSAIRCKIPSGSPPLTHRDWLGSLMGLGLKRENVGDISICGDGADIVVLKETEKFLLSEYTSVGRSKIDVCAIPINEFRAPKQSYKEERGSVASLRLDNLISEAFSLSREKASEAIESGLVFANGIQATKPDAKVKEGTKLVLRGKGKVVFARICGETRRGKISILLNKYI